MPAIPLDAIRVVSLEHRRDRQQQLLESVQKAKEAGLIPDVGVQFCNRYPQHVALSPPSCGMRGSYYHTGQEHQRILEDVFVEKRECALILEDDAFFTEAFFRDAPAFWEEVESHAPDWLALFLGGTDVHGREQISRHVALNKGSRRCHAYIVNRPGMWRLYDHLFCDRTYIDWAYVHLMEADHCCYSPVGEWFVDTVEGWSDNTAAMAARGS